MLRNSILAFLFLLTLNGNATTPPNNAVSLSLGGACATYTNAFATENNIAALVFGKNEVYLALQNKFGMAEYSTLTLATNYKLNSSALGFCYTNGALANLKSHKINVGFSKQFSENFSAGVGLNYHTFSSSDLYYTAAQALTVNAGIYYKVNDKLNAGFGLNNPTRSMLLAATNERLPASYRFGIDYILSENIKLYSDALQVSEERLQFNGGVEIKTKQVAFRGGFATNSALAFGVGYTASKLTLDFAAQYHNQLGLSPALNFGYAF